MTTEQKNTAINEYVKKIESTVANRQNDIETRNLHAAAYAARQSREKADRAIVYCDVRGIEYASVEQAIEIASRR